MSLILGSPFKGPDTERRDSERLLFMSLESFLLVGDLSPGAPDQQRFYFQLANLPLSKLDNATSLSGATDAPNGWRLTLGDGTGAALEASLNTTGLGVRGVSRGLSSNLGFQSAQHLTTLPEAAADPYEPWIVTVPTLYTEVFWLRPQGAGTDLVVPFRTELPLRSGYAYTQEAFLSVIKAAAQDPKAKIPPASAHLAGRALPLAAPADPRSAVLARMQKRRAEQRMKDRLTLAERLCRPPQTGKEA